MGWLDRARGLFQTPADRRLADAASEAFASAPQPAIGGAQGPGRAPPVNWLQEQPDPTPRTFTFQPGYNDHLYQQFSTPLSFEGFVLGRIRNAVALHRLGFFYESWALSVAMLGFAPYLAALQQAVAAVTSQPRFIRGGPKGLARDIAAEVEAALVPRDGLLPSPFLPPTLLATSIIYQRTLGFAVYQHIDGDPDPVTEVRPRYTRIWEPWAVQYIPSPAKWMAITSEGYVEIKNDGKFTLVADEERPHLSGAVLALGEETLMGRNAQESRSEWIYRNGQIKWIAKLPERIATHGEAGDSFWNSVINIAGPDGLGVLPYGSEFESLALTRDTSQSFGDTLASVIDHCSMVLLGSSGAITAGGKSQYEAKDGGASTGMRKDLIDRPTIAHVRAINQGAIQPWLDTNYAAGIAACQRVKTWVFPAYVIPLDDPDLDARVASKAKRMKALTDQIVAEREAGAPPDQDRVRVIASDLETEPIVLAASSGTPVARLDLAPTDLAKVVTVDEARASRQLPPIGGDRGAMTISELEAASAPAPFGSGAPAPVEATPIQPTEETPPA